MFLFPQEALEAAVFVTGVETKLQQYHRLCSDLWDNAKGLPIDDTTLAAARQAYHILARDLTLLGGAAFGSDLSEYRPDELLRFLVASNIIWCQNWCGPCGRTLTEFVYDFGLIGAIDEYEYRLAAREALKDHPLMERLTLSVFEKSARSRFVGLAGLAQQILIEFETAWGSPSNTASGVAHKTYYDYLVQRYGQVDLEELYKLVEVDIGQAAIKSFIELETALRHMVETDTSRMSGVRLVNLIFGQRDPPGKFVGGRVEVAQTQRERLRDLLAGAFGFFRNPPVHSLDNALAEEDARAVVVFVALLLRVVGALKAEGSETTEEAL